LSPDTLVGNDDDPCNDDDDDDSSDSCYGNHDQQLLYTDTRHATSVRCTLGRIYAHVHAMRPNNGDGDDAGIYV